MATPAQYPCLWCGRELLGVSGIVGTDSNVYCGPAHRKEWADYLARNPVVQHRTLLPREKRDRLDGEGWSVLRKVARK